MWETDNITQIASFFYAMLSGVFFSLFYDVFRVFRKVIKHGRAALLAEDIIYSVIIALAAFCVLLSLTGGEIRLYIFAGIFCGFLLSRFTFSRLFVFLLVKFLRLILILLGFISRGAELFSAVLDRFYVNMALKAKKLFKFFLNKVKKT